MAAYHPSNDALPNGEAYERFVKANFLADGSPPTVVLALHGTEVNAVSICGLCPSESGTCGPGAYLAFGLDEIVNDMRGKDGVVIVCLVAHGGLCVSSRPMGSCRLCKRLMFEGVRAAAISACFGPPCDHAS